MRSSADLSLRPRQREQLVRPWHVILLGLLMVTALVLLVPTPDTLEQHVTGADRLSLQYLRLMLRMRPNDAELKLRLVQALLDAHQFEEAQRLLTELLPKLNDPRLKLRASLLALVLDLGRYMQTPQGALRDHELQPRVAQDIESLLQQPLTVDELIRLAAASLSIGRPDLATRVYLRLAEVDPQRRNKWLAEAAQQANASNQPGLAGRLYAQLAQDERDPKAARRFALLALQALVGAGLGDEALELARRYAERYCAALLVQHRGYVFPGGALSSTRSALLELGAPTGSLISHLKKIAENASLPSLDGRFTQSLASCLGQFAPVAAAVTPAKDGTYPGLKPYIEIIAGMLKELDTGKPAEAREDGKPQTLQDLLTPLGRLGFSILAQQEGSPDRKVRQFLDSAGLGGLLAPPFLAPVQHVARLGLSDVEQVLATQWSTVLLPIVRPLLSLYPLDRRAERELQPAQLDVLKPVDGLFWSMFQKTFGPVVLEQGGQWQPRKWESGSVSLPGDMLPLVNQLARLSAAAFGPDGARRPLLFELKPLPVQTCVAGQPATGSFLAAGKAQVFGANTRPALSTLSLPWWQQDIASVGIEISNRPGERSAQSIEVADSLWSLFRLLERARQEQGVYSWTLPAEEGQSACEVRFEILRDPSTLFRIKAR